MSDLICPRCGKSSRDGEFIEAFCASCAPVRIVCPTKVEVEVCTRCQRGRIRGEWTPLGSKNIQKMVIAKCRGDIAGFKYNEETGEAVFAMESGASVSKMILLNRKKTICQQCSRKSGGYFEGIIQLRGDRAKVEKVAVKVMEALEKKTFIAKTEEKEEGIDIYTGSSKAVLTFVNSLGAKTLITKKLVGRDQGRRLYRTTFLIRF